MSIINVDSSASLLQSLKYAQAGDVIALAPGFYTGVKINDFQMAGQVTITSQDPSNPAQLGSLDVNGSKGLTFLSLEFVSSPNGAVFPFKVKTSEDVHFKGISVHGTMDGNPHDDTGGLMIGSSRNISVTGSEFQQLRTALDVGGNNGVRIEGNYFHDIRIDGIVAPGASNILINGNYFTNFDHAAGDHSDAIQFFTTNRKASATDITITNNVIVQGSGDVMQGVFMRDEVGGLPYINVKISGNVILGGNWNGISVNGGQNVEVTDNFLAAYAGGNTPWIALKNVDGAVVTGNAASKHMLGATNLTDSGNTISAAIPNMGADTLRLWLQQNPIYFLKLPEAVLDVLDGKAGLVGAIAPAGLGPEALTSHHAIADLAPAPPPNLVVGTAGAEQLTGDLGDDDIQGGAGDDTIVGQSGSNYLRGGDGDDQIVGGSGFDDINGNVGADTAWGNDGNDWVVGGKDNDLLSGDAGDDIVYGNLGADTVSGGDGNDIVRGGQGNDWIDAGSGADWISGDRGDDTIIGGAGADTFHTFADAGRDVVQDFNRAEGDRVMVEAGSHYSVAQTGADVTISMAGGGQMVLVGVNLAHLTGDWIFSA